MNSKLVLARVAGVFTALLLVSSCSYETAFNDVSCSSEGATEGGRVCRNGYWVSMDAGTDLPIDQPTTDADMASDGDMTCVPETNSVFCSRLEFDCGEVTDLDNCEVSRTVSCGTCTEPETCGGAGEDNVCGCESESPADFCRRNVKTCDDFEAEDNCGILRTENCGTCVAPATCGGGGTDNTCACPDQTDIEFCAENNAECDAFEGTDVCGQTRRVDCGSCTLPETCNGAGVANECGCTGESNAEFCTRLGKNCGVVTDLDNCGNSRTADCGTCSNPESCAGGGQANVCGCADDASVCSFLGKNCGTVNSSAVCTNKNTVTCGLCTLPQSCGGGGQGNICGCTPESDAAFCTRTGKNCGSYTTFDNCGFPRTANCGSCTNPESCGAGGTQNVCGCGSDASVCGFLNKNCGTVSSSAVCSNKASVTCGSCSTPETCGGGGTANVCECPNTAAGCSALGKDCDSVDINSVCSNYNNVNCGSCTNPETCGGGNPGEANVCACTPESDAAFCTRYGKDCGSFNATDNCGDSRTADCGPVSCGGGPETCGGGGEANVCECTSPADGCNALGKNCDNVDISSVCSNYGVVNCGSCTNPETCGGAGTTNVCECPNAAAGCSALGKDCGTVDISGVCNNFATTNCGSCMLPDTCGGGAMGPNVCDCTPEDDATFCSRNGAVCGSLTALDNCGVSRTVADCGTCTNGAETCGGGGTANQCGCSVATACMDQNLNCGTVDLSGVCSNLGASETCGMCTTPESCGGGGVLNVCGCSASEACADQGFDCGDVDLSGVCTNLGTENCGVTCTMGDTCGGGGDSNVCG